MAMSEVYADVRLGAQGRLVVPARIRRSLGFSSGEKLVARVEENRLIIEKTGAVQGRLHERFTKVAGRSLADELIDERRREANRVIRPQIDAEDQLIDERRRKAKSDGCR